MAIEKVKAYFKEFGICNKILEFEVSSATVALAAKALGTDENRIAKTLAFKLGDKAVLIVAAGDAKVDNRKFKDFFGVKAKMLTPEETENLVGHAVGGVCPFAVLPTVTDIYLDESLKRFQTVFPACGSSNSAVEMSPEDLFRAAKATAYIDVCKGWQTEN